jgi:hypothetical protein
MTDTTLDGWNAGYEFGDDPDALTPPVTHGATPPVTPAGPWGVTWTYGEPVTPADGGPDSPLGIGQWDEPGGEPGPAAEGSLASVLDRLAAAVKGSPLLGGSALAAELADPRPGTWGQHWRHVTSHPGRPEGTWEGAGFVAGHLAITGPLKLAGKAMTVTGNALSWTGKRADRAGDHFTSAVIFIVLAAAMAFILVIGAGQVISYLP